jgi:uncharacterized protein
MDSRTLQTTVDFFCSRRKEMEFVWHGGEPLLAGKEFFRMVGEYQSRWDAQGKRTMNFLQTNGTMIDEDWADILKDLHFCVGVSLDAPRNTHERLRPSKSGSPVFERIIEGIRLLKQKDIFNGVSCCIGKSNVGSPKEIIDCFLKYDIKSIKFLRIKNDDPSVPWADEAISADQFADFLLDVFKIWIDLDDVDLEVRDIRSVVELILGGSFRECSYMGACDKFVTVYNDGSIYACDSFRNDPKYRFGTVFDPYEDVLHSANFEAFAKMQATLPPVCADRWRVLCGGGCLKDRSCQDEGYRAYVNMLEQPLSMSVGKTKGKGTIPVCSSEPRIPAGV